MKRWIALALAALMLISLAACGQTDKHGTDETRTEDGGKAGSVSMTPDEIEEKIKEALGDGYVCEADKDLTYIGLDMENVESYCARESTIPSVYPDTVIILKVKDGYADNAVKTLNEVYAQLVDYIRQYPFGTAKVMNGRLFRNGNYAALIIAGASADEETSSEEETKLAESEYAKIDAVWKEIFGEAMNIAVIPEDNGSSAEDGGNFDDGEDDFILGG